MTRSFLPDAGARAWGCSGQRPGQQGLNPKTAMLSAIATSLAIRAAAETLINAGSNAFSFLLKTGFTRARVLRSGQFAHLDLENQIHQWLPRPAAPTKLKPSQGLKQSRVHGGGDRTNCKSMQTQVCGETLLRLVKSSPNACLSAIYGYVQATQYGAESFIVS